VVPRPPGERDPDGAALVIRLDDARGEEEHRRDLGEREEAKDGRFLEEHDSSAAADHGSNVRDDPGAMCSSKR